MVDSLKTTAPAMMGLLQPVNQVMPTAMVIVATAMIRIIASS
jgi:cytolysin (calcineurin-like family phosphatase)